MGLVAPQVSVVIPVYNGEKYLAECIQSVLDQQHPALEVLIVDNASTDDTPSVAGRFPSVDYFRLEQKGLSRALNHGIDHSRGEFLGFIDADDLWRPGKLAAQLEVFACDSTTDIVFGHVEQFISPELDRSARARLRIRDKVLPGRFRSSMLIRRQSFARVGPFDCGINFGEFIEWYMRAKEVGLREVLLADVLAQRRIHGANMTFAELAKRIEYVRVLKRGLDRRRRQGET